ncbi:MAG: hypothetical protein O2782_06185 [bacterium]|nr:hypothetical protein [bacterium]
MTPICTVTKEIYVAHTEPRVGTSVSMSYIGQGLRRRSDDNGRTWSKWEQVC